MVADRGPGRNRPLLERHHRQRRRGKRLRLVQGPMGLFLADHAAAPARADCRSRTRPGQARVPGDDDDAQDRHREDRGRRGRRAGRCVSSPAPSSISLDGVMQAPGGPERGPDQRLSTSAAGCSLLGRGTWARSSNVIDGDYDLLLGKRTYDIFAAYWPYNQDNPIGEKFQRINKYVLTHSDEPLEWDNSQQAVGRYRRGGRRAQGERGPRPADPGQQHALSRRCFAAGLIDRLVLMTFPVLLGEGKRIFDGSETARRAQACRSFRLATGRDHHDLRAGWRGSDRHLRDQAAERGRARAAASNGQRKDAGEPRPLRPPLLVYTWKVLIPL